MEQKINNLEECIKELNNRFDAFEREFVKLKTEIQINSKLTKETHRAVYGNGNPEKSIVTRIAKNEAKLWVIFGILIPMSVLVIIEIIKKI